MSTGWTSSSFPVSSPEERDPIAVYTAVISWRIERSQLSLLAAAEDPRARGALVAAPEWSPFTWPASVGSLDAQAASKLAALKFIALFTFASELGGETSEEITAALNVKFPHLSDAQLMNEKQGVRFLLIETTATVWNDGQADWAYVVPAAGTPPPLGSQRVEDFDLFIKNIIRADLARMVEVSAKN